MPIRHRADNPPKPSFEKESFKKRRVTKMQRVIYVGLMLLSAYVFGAALLLLVGSLGVSIWEIQISVRALEIHLKDMENPLDKRDSE